MRRLAVAVLAGLMVGLTWIGVSLAEPAETGPFGVNMGDDPSTMPACRHDVGLKWVCSQFPKDLPAAAYRTVNAHPSTGICSVMVLADVNEQDQHGTYVSNSVDYYRDVIAKTYGEPDKIDTLVPDSIWSNPQDWTKSIDVGDRQYKYRWGDDGQLSKNGVVRIYVRAMGYSYKMSGALIGFVFENIDACEEAQKSDDASVF